jgi:hypothetical protein
VRWGASWRRRWAWRHGRPAPKAALFKVLGDVNEVERVFLIIMQQPEY